MERETGSDTARRHLKSTGKNEPLGRCPGCTKWVLENDVNFRTTTTGNVWHARCAEGILDASGVLVRIVNLYATAVLGALEFINVGRIAPALKGLEEATTAVNQLMRQAGVSKMFPTPARPILGIARPPARDAFTFDNRDDPDPEDPT